MDATSNSALKRSGSPAWPAGPPAPPANLQRARLGAQWLANQIEQNGGSEHPIHLIFGVTNDPDLVKIGELEGYAARMGNFTFTTVVDNAKLSGMEIIAVPPPAMPSGNG